VIPVIDRKPKYPQRWTLALDLPLKLFTKSPKEIARSLKRSAERIDRRTSSPYRSAMSKLAFYIRRVGRQLPASRRKALRQAKDELRRLFDRV
jgi:hypothetical protein